MAKPMYQIRIIASACITRYNGGERDVSNIVDSYGMAQEDRDLVLAEIYAKRPDIAPADQGSAT